MNNKEDINSVRKKKFWKFWITMVFVNVGIIAVIIKLISIQILNQDYYKEKAKRQHESRIMLSAERGKIYDRNGKVIASNFVGLSVAVDPKRVSNLKKISQILNKKLGIPEIETIEKIRRAKGSFVWLIRGKNPELLEELKHLQDKGLILIEEPRRIYHYGTTASQVIGLTDIDNNGLSGIELQLDSVLKGQKGYMVLNRDGIGRLKPAADLPIIPAINGNSIKLTIDIELQRIVEYELKRGVENAMAESGTVVAIEPQTGEILAIASYPNYDPHHSSKPQPGDMRVRAITDIYEPGSTFKTITACAAIEENIVNEEDKFNGYGGVFQGNGYVIRDVHGLGVVTFREAMANSSNIIMANVANMMSDNVFYKYIRDFGFGIKTGIDFPGEVTGKVPKPHQFVHSTKRYLGHGYSLAVTPLQVCNAYSAIANKGVLMKPFLVKSIFDNEGELIYEAKPETIRRVISEKTSDRVKRLLLEVVQKGTGKAVKFKNIYVCGKTGTSQQLVEGRYSKENYTASFAGFFPYDNPKIAMIVVIDKPRTSIYGGATAAPVFRDIVLRWSNTNSNKLDFIAESDSIKNERKIVPNLIGLNYNQAFSVINKLGIKLVADNSNIENGIICEQTPTPNTAFSKDLVVKVKLSNPAEARSLDSALVNLKGLSVKEALSVLKNYKVNVNVIGNGYIYEATTKGVKNGVTDVLLHCSYNN